MYFKLFLITIFLLTITSCNRTESDISRVYPSPAESAIENTQPYPRSYFPTVSLTHQIPPHPNDAPKPKIGYGSISGTLYSFTTGITLAKTHYYLIQGDGPNRNEMPPLLVGPTDEDIKGITDEKGQFFINNIPPGNYFLIVEAPYSYSPAVTSMTDFSPLLLKIIENEKYPLGVVFVSWP